MEDENRRYKRSLSDVPDDIIRQVVHHFMETFSIRDFGGIYTAINSLYTKTSECTNVLNALAQTLSLDEETSPFQVRFKCKIDHFNYFFYYSYCRLLILSLI